MSPSASSPADHYRVLGVELDTETEEIRRAYLQMARRLHPDFHSDADAATRASLQRKMQQVNESWAVLSDPELRHAYDRQRRRDGPAADRAAGRPKQEDEPRRQRSELEDEVRSTYDGDGGPNDPVRARLVALSVVSLGIAILMLMAWVIVGWRGFGAGLMVALIVSFGAFLSIPLSAVFTSYRSDRS